MSEILGVDLGTNSIGLTKRNTELGKNVVDQLEFFSSIIFQKGVGSGKTGEYSYAVERTKHRSTRRLYQARKYRIWTTLDVLMKNGFCPITLEQLDRWRKYDKTKGLKREYPADAIEFEKWVRLDFDGDGVADYSSPYQLRAELATTQFDFVDPVNKYKLGRALYHIAQRRGFKSSKGETIKEQEKEAEEKEFFSDVEIQIDLKKSEEKKSKDLLEYKNVNLLPTVGCCFNKLLKEGIRVRASNFQAVRSQYEEEIKYIFDFQDGIELDCDFYKSVHKAIFYKRPLRSQKGLVGTCTLETSKSRCPISHPEFEEFRAWSFINNIKYRKTPTDEWMTLSDSFKEKLFEDKFLRTKANFKFEEIRDWLEKKVGFYLSTENRTINYKDKTNVAGCPISGRFKNLLGINWNSFEKQTSKTRTNYKTGEVHDITYTTEDIWHICFSFEDQERVEEFAKESLGFDTIKSNEMVRLWSAIPQGYSMLSLKAIRNIIRFLKKGLIYSDAVLLAKLPDIFGENNWMQHEEYILDNIAEIVEQNRKEKRTLNIVNNLIASYKSLELDEQFAYKNTDYRLDKSDYSNIERITIDTIGEKSWDRWGVQEKKNLLIEVELKYQQFFSSSKRDFYKLPKLGDSLKLFLSNDSKFNFFHCENGFIDPKTKLPCNCKACRKLKLLYHPSQIEFYKPAKVQEIEWEGATLSLKLLDSPKIGAFKNPMAMRTLHILRKAINHLLKEGTITEDTRIVIETARDLNDANMRWAIEAYQREREKENKIFEDAIRELYEGTGRVITEDEIDKARILVEQSEILEFGWLENGEITDKQKKKNKEKGVTYSKDVTKYRLWLEQGCRCIYTGKMINISDLFSDNKVDFEHTIPRSISFDNSLANLTVCDAHFNRKVKRNQIPSQLANYEEILARLQPWEDKVERLIDNVNFWKAKAKQAQTKDTKDNAIRQRHLWQMELDYWQNKLGRFKMEEVTSGFKNSQLVDTRIITKYATHYLKSVFNSVDVQKGRITSDFRKMLGVQSIDEKKSRDKHSHHAVDAAILTLIPSAAKRDKMLKLYYEIQEKERFEDIEHLRHELEKEKRSCNLGNVSTVSKFIEDHILINHISKDQALTPAHKKERKRGKEILYPDKNGVLKNRWITGDCMRGQLHGETFYGAITQVKRDEDGSFLRDKNGRIICNEEVLYVVRKELKFKKNTQDSGFSSLNELKDKIVDKELFKIIEKQCENRSFKEACEDGIFMLDKKGRKVNKIRHIRCFADTKNPINVKRQDYLGSKPYKQNYYAQVGDLYVLCLYRNGKQKEYRIFSLFDITENRRLNSVEIPNEILSIKTREPLFLEYILKAGDKILLCRNENEVVQDLDSVDIIKRLYVINGFENDGFRVVMKQHICALKDKDLGKGESPKDFDNLPKKIRCGINTLMFKLEGRDFEVSYNGKIKFKD
jgi:CRISPR-associated endonuclease Csn1